MTSRDNRQIWWEDCCISEIKRFLLFCWCGWNTRLWLKRSILKFKHISDLENIKIKWSISQIRLCRHPDLPLLLRHAAVDGDGREILLHQQLGQSHTAMHWLNKDHHLTGNKRKGLHICAGNSKDINKIQTGWNQLSLSLKETKLFKLLVEQQGYKCLFLFIKPFHKYFQILQ